MEELVLIAIYIRIHFIIYLFAPFQNLPKEINVAELNPPHCILKTNDIFQN